MKHFVSVLLLSQFLTGLILPPAILTIHVTHHLFTHTSAHHSHQHRRTTDHAHGQLLGTAVDHASRDSVLPSEQTDILSLLFLPLCSPSMEAGLSLANLQSNMLFHTDQGLDLQNIPAPPAPPPESGLHQM
jgi:hypothetical protein